MECKYCGEKLGTGCNSNISCIIRENNDQNHITQILCRKDITTINAQLFSYHDLINTLVGENKVIRNFMDSIADADSLEEVQLLIEQYKKL